MTMTPDELQTLDRMLAEFMGTYKCSCGSPKCSNVWLQYPANCLLTHWHPTTDIAQAFMVAEKISKQNVFFVLRRYQFFDLRGGSSHWRWRSYFDTETNYKEDKESPAIAISLAAKAWLELGGDAK